MIPHLFLLQHGQWIGEGKISFSQSYEKIPFYTKWEIQEIKDQKIICVQTIELKGTNEHLYNHFILSEITPTSFVIELESELIPKVRGEGMINPQFLAWEFQGNHLEGFENFCLQENGDYLFHSEFTSEEMQTIVDGRLWQKTIL